MTHTKRFRSLTAWLIAAASLSMGAALSHAANVTDTFELDGNVAGAAADWAGVNTGGGTANIVARTGVLSDAAPKSVFTGGGSKDDLDLSGALAGAGGWKSKDGSVPPKDDITNAYAVAYNVAGDLVIYAGAERGENSGNAFMGFWFFKSKISINANGSFSGQHTVGDVLVLANYENGGLAVDIQVLEWNPAQATLNGTLRQLAGGPTSPATCGAPGSSPLFCGITNAVGGETTPWGSTLRQAEFLEVGINISQVLKLAGSQSAPCFSSFMAETRSSSSVSATLKDFVLGSFDVCGIRVTKSCDTGQANANGTSIDYSFGGKISNVGFGGLSSIALTDTPQTTTPAATVGPFAYYKCDALGKPDFTLPAIALPNPLAAGGDVCYASTFNTNINKSTNKISVVANTGPTTTTQADSGTATCPRLEFPTGLLATKSCVASLEPNGSYLFVKVDVSGTVCNQGNLGLTGVSVTDFVAGMQSAGLPVSSTTLGPKGSATECTTFSGSYVPTAPDTGTTTEFSDAVSARGTPPAISGVSEVTTAANQGATCNLCPGAQCAAPNGATLNTLLKQQQKK